MEAIRYLVLNFIVLLVFNANIYYSGNFEVKTYSKSNFVNQAFLHISGDSGSEPEKNINFGLKYLTAMDIRLQGLNDIQVHHNREKFGPNILKSKGGATF